MISQTEFFAYLFEFSEYCNVSFYFMCDFASGQL